MRRLCINVAKGNMLRKEKPRAHRTKPLGHVACRRLSTSLRALQQVASLLSKWRRPRESSKMSCGHPATDAATPNVALDGRRRDYGAEFVPSFFFLLLGVPRGRAIEHRGFGNLEKRIAYLLCRFGLVQRSRSCEERARKRDETAAGQRMPHGRLVNGVYANREQKKCILFLPRSRNTNSPGVANPGPAPRSVAWLSSVLFVAEGVD